MELQESMDQNSEEPKEQRRESGTEVFWLSLTAARLREPRLCIKFI